MYNDYLQDEIDSLKLIFFDKTIGNRRVIAGGFVGSDRTHYKIISYIDPDNSTPIVWTIAYPEDTVAFADYLKTDCEWLMKGVRYGI